MPVKYQSKRLKEKNILPINHLPMFVYVANKFKKSKIFSKFIVSTENKKIMKLCEDFKIDYYPTGLVTSVVDTIEDMPDTVADNLSDDSSKGEIIYHIVGWLNYHGKAKDGKTIPQQQIEAIKRHLYI